MPKQIVIQHKPEELNIGLDNASKPIQSANSFFHFMNRKKYLFDSLKNKKLCPRFCEEDISDFGLGFNKVLICEKCFCDIPLHNVSAHKNEYGDYCIGLSKEWGFKNGLQPVIYYNSSSEFKKMMRNAYFSAMQGDDEDAISTLIEPLNHIFKYQKKIVGYDGRIKKNKHYTDEKEWRFVPNILDDLDFGEIIVKQAIINNNFLREEFNNKIAKSNYTLNYDYNDIKYLFVRNDYQRGGLIKLIRGFQIEDEIKDKLITKICVWEELEGDF